MIIPSAIILTIVWLGYRIIKTNHKGNFNPVNSSETCGFTSENDYYYYYAENNSGMNEDVHNSSNDSLNQDTGIHTTDMFHDPFNSVFNDGMPHNRSIK